MYCDVLCVMLHPMLLTASGSSSTPCELLPGFAEACSVCVRLVLCGLPAGWPCHLSTAPSEEVPERGIQAE